LKGDALRTCCDRSCPSLLAEWQAQPLLVPGASSAVASPHARVHCLLPARLHGTAYRYCATAAASCAYCKALSLLHPSLSLMHSCIVPWHARTATSWLTTVKSSASASPTLLARCSVATQQRAHSHAQLSTTHRVCSQLAAERKLRPPLYAFSAPVPAALAAATPCSPALPYPRLRPHPFA
jgi:hypothetical protein